MLSNHYILIVFPPCYDALGSTSTRTSKTITVQARAQCIRLIEKHEKLFLQLLALYSDWELMDYHRSLSFARQEGGRMRAQLRIARSYVNQVCQNLLAIFVQKCIGGGRASIHAHTPNSIAQRSAVVLFGPEFKDRDEKYEQGICMCMYVYMCMCMCYVLCVGVICYVLCVMCCKFISCHIHTHTHAHTQYLFWY